MKGSFWAHFDNFSRVSAHGWLKIIGIFVKWSHGSFDFNESPAGLCEPSFYRKAQNDAKNHQKLAKWAQKRLWESITSFFLSWLIEVGRYLFKIITWLLWFIWISYRTFWAFIVEKSAKWCRYLSKLAKMSPKWAFFESIKRFSLSWLIEIRWFLC